MSNLSGNYRRSIIYMNDQTLDESVICCVNFLSGQISIFIFSTTFFNRVTLYNLILENWFNPCYLKYSQIGFSQNLRSDFVL